VRAVQLLAGRIAFGALGFALVEWSPVAARTPRMALSASLVLGGAAGAALFAALARAWRPPPGGRACVARAVAWSAPVLAAGAAAEEAVWRFGVLGGLEPWIGSGGALALSSAGFALAHLRRAGPRSLPSHLAAGAVFGAVYLVTGRLAAAIVAHLVYNALVVAACAAPSRTEPAAGLV
jgi:membrane protease YdiL (CAAX protease family)